MAHLESALAAALDARELTPDERAHLDGCPACRAEYDQWRAAVAAGSMRPLAGAAPPRRRRRLPRRRYRPVVMVLAALVPAGLALVLVWLVR